jgi:hypothetical protein
MTAALAQMDAGVDRMRAGLAEHAAGLTGPRKG